MRRLTGILLAFSLALAISVGVALAARTGPAATSEPVSGPPLTPTSAAPPATPTPTNTVTPTASTVGAWPITDAHIHYSHDSQALFTPAEAIDRLRKAGITRAFVSSSSDDGTQALYALAPDLIVPVLRPYRTRSETSSWLSDETVIPYLEERLKRYQYIGIGEFHVYGADADSPIMRRVVQLAKEYGLLLQVHGDVEAVERLYRQDPDARILWAHAGFASPAVLREMLGRYRLLWADLALRTDAASNGELSPEWRALFLDFPDRFLLGTDTWVPDRWNAIGPNAEWARLWLPTLPPAVARNIATGNAETLMKARKR